MCHQNFWMDALPSVLLGLRCAYKEDIKATSAELVYGTTIRLPGEFFGDNSNRNVSGTASDYVTKLRSVMQSIRPAQTSAHATRNVFVHQAMSNCRNVFVRNDAVTPLLQPPYDGPYQVLDRGPKTYKLLVRGKPKTISIDRLKPAFEATSNEEELVPTATTTSSSGCTSTSSTSSPVPTPVPTPTPYTTRYGRQVRFTVR